MNDPVGPRIAEALGMMLNRSFRAGLLRPVTEHLGDAVDASTYPVLRGIDQLGAISSASLGAEIGLDRSVVSRRAGRLAEAGLVTGGPDPTDARATLLSLTPEGRRVVDEMKRRLAILMEARLDAWTATDRDSFAELLSRFALTGVESAAAEAASEPGIRAPTT
jgi:DNA-binding MarR family transcriptional regulator